MWYLPEEYNLFIPTLDIFHHQLSENVEYIVSRELKFEQIRPLQKNRWP